MKVPSTVKCPICNHRAENQPPAEQQFIRTYICDTADCPVSSFVIRYKSL